MDQNMTNKMTDLGKAPMESPSAVPEKGNTAQQQKDYPRQEFTTDQMPDLKGAKVGDKVTMTIEGEVCAVEQRENYENDNGQNPEAKIRVTVKMLQGMAKVSGGSEAVAKETVKETQAKKEKDFNKKLGLDTQEESA